MAPDKTNEKTKEVGEENSKGMHERGPEEQATEGRASEAEEGKMLVA